MPWRRLNFRGTSILLGLTMLSLGCYAELAGSYYPVVDAGDRVADSAYGFSINFGIALKVRRVRTSVGIGYDAVKADYEDATGPGTVGHAAGPYSARLDLMAKKLGGDFASETWLDLSAGGTIGSGAVAVDYDSSVDVPPGARDLKHSGSTWSAYVGPSVHLSQGQEGDILLTLAPSVVNSEVDTQDRMRAYGAQARVVVALGVDPPAVDWGNFGIIRLMRSGGSAGGSGLDKDMQRHNRGQERQRDRANEREERIRKEKERKRLEEGR